MTVKVVVDTSVWIDHFRRSNTQLLSLLKEHRVVTHELLIGEIRCGSVPAPRSVSLALLANLAQIKSVSLSEVQSVIEAQRLYGCGCGLIDVAVLVATLRTPEALLWSRDKSMRRLALTLGVGVIDGDLPARSRRACSLPLHPPPPDRHALHRAEDEPLHQPSDQDHQRESGEDAICHQLVAVLEDVPAQAALAG